ncbi:putative ABC transporter membrane subunit YhdY [Rhodovastum atsumiense]|uniref:Amino acid ABC transporter permease n=1 Tax=Rhodovastum atsumiense TaxID=504468 RepID=A0A5M6IK71_9PROT|nr:amino acid ABC transporter permease [Rhodovastum atsumiense]KAA5608656.1 amino acid ABC transporter permease [Rhodovastum atsumiense]CAH2598813.1 putative ABC transporter membrane subunit YhdY [Rhodovastum atsumiense]
MSDLAAAPRAWLQPLLSGVNSLGGSWRRALFGTPLNTALTLGCLALLAWAVPPLLRWTILDATWAGNAEACAARGGACWAFIVEKLRFITFGPYPAGQRWQAAMATILLLALVVASCVPRLWHRLLPPAWVAVIALAVVLMTGSLTGPVVASDKWGGMPLTILLCVVGLAGAFPLAVLLAIGRRSNMRVVRLLATACIEVVRGLPLIAVLYIATLLVPLMLPPGLVLDKLLRTQAGIILFAAAYMAEIIRAGLQGVPVGQYEAARALGLGFWPMMRLVVLPQALRTVIPAFVTLGIGILQDTTLVVTIGLFDFLNAARTAASDQDWLGFYDEAFSFAAVVYFVLCFIASRYSLWLERRLRPGG